MRARVVAAIEIRLAIVQEVAESLLVHRSVPALRTAEDP
jgi:hypothetical protein